MPISNNIADAISALNVGGVIAYPTEYCFGLGCDPKNHSAIARILNIKRRHKEQGVILIAANIEQVSNYADLNLLPDLDLITGSWPGPNTWLLPARDSVTSWVRGSHSSVAMRIPSYALCRQLCYDFEDALVSTSANRHGQNSLLDAESVNLEFGDEIDLILDMPVQHQPSHGTSKASTIRDAITGKQLR
jgi:L-threonylcarbamoyladenylate synthase